MTPSQTDTFTFFSIRSLSSQVTRYPILLTNRFAIQLSPFESSSLISDTRIDNLFKFYYRVPNKASHFYWFRPKIQKTTPGMHLFISRQRFSLRRQSSIRYGKHLLAKHSFCDIILQGQQLGRKAQRFSMKMMLAPGFGISLQPA